MKVLCFKCGKEMEVDNYTSDGFYFHDECIKFKSKLTKGQKRKILKSDK